MSVTITFPTCVGADNKKRSGAISILDHTRVRDARSFFSSVVVTRIAVSVWLQKGYGILYLVGPYPNTVPLPNSVSDVLAVPHAKMLATSDQSDTIHTWDLPVVPLEYDLGVVPIRSGHPDIWFGLATKTGSGKSGTCIVIRAEVTIECSGQSFGLWSAPVTQFDLGVEGLEAARPFHVQGSLELDPRDSDNQRDVSDEHDYAPSASRVPGA